MSVGEIVAVLTEEPWRAPEMMPHIQAAYRYVVSEAE